MADKPEVFDDLTDIVNAFFTLSRSRSFGNGHYQYLSIGDMIKYADSFEFPDRQEFITYMQAADHVFMQHQLKGS